MMVTFSIWLTTALGALRTPAGRMALIAFAAALALGTAYLVGREHGREATLARIERQNDRAEHTDREAEQDVDACFDRGESWRWDDATGTCVRAVP